MHSAQGEGMWGGASVADHLASVEQQHALQLSVMEEQLESAQKEACGCWETFRNPNMNPNADGPDGKASEWRESLQATLESQKEEAELDKSYDKVGEFPGADTP